MLLHDVKENGCLSVYSIESSMGLKTDVKCAYRCVVGSEKKTYWLVKMYRWSEL